MDANLLDAGQPSRWHSSSASGGFFAGNLIILNFATLISLFTQPIKFCDGQLVLSLAPLSPLCFLSVSITDAYLSNGAFEEPPGRL